MTIVGQVFVHMLCVFVLPCSNSQCATICLSESMVALRKGVQRALFQIGRRPEWHQTDNSTAATHRIPADQVGEVGGSKRPFNTEYLALMAHLGMKPRTIMRWACTRPQFRCPDSIECYQPRAKRMSDGRDRCHLSRRKREPLMTFDPSQHVGKTVVIRGTAYDARAGAIVELADRTPIYIAGLAEWDPGLQGKPLEVTGLLKELAARVSPVPAGGPQLHGLAAPSFVLENATWTALP